LPVTLVAIMLAAVAIALFVAWPPLLPMPQPVLPSPSLLPATLIAITIAHASLALFIAAVIIRRTLSYRGHVVVNALLSPLPPAFDAPVAS
jgi:hypothetical protein